MRWPVSTFITLALAAGLAACGKPSNQGQQNAQAPSGEQAAAPAAATAPEPSDADLKAAAVKLPAPYNAADIANGKAKFAFCASCHTIAPGGPNLTGPNLSGIAGRKAASVANYHYSDALKGAGITWDAAHLEKWTAGPQAMVPGTKMTFVGIKDPKDRTDLVAYLMAESGAVKHD